MATGTLKGIAEEVGAFVGSTLGLLVVGGAAVWWLSRKAKAAALPSPAQVAATNGFAGFNSVSAPNGLTTPHLTVYGKGMGRALKVGETVRWKGRTMSISQVLDFHKEAHVILRDRATQEKVKLDVHNRNGLRVAVLG